ncbi:hypothetical protein HYPSUDRAFT_201097 [Hypholoma sublateritium FD-334 SS-4]|uniref:Uncharacterized protein n=1 Tax=Hypholoma sublateritium (strain FD-334 SS-4) TaxID=945553 RepID=A0A0D2P4S5_HYPSF|nr:hypothetical protein HYPSUDRAFT_201097 [Hypholoma sublateritium FD-334 SS-4]
MRCGRGLIHNMRPPPPRAASTSPLAIVTGIRGCGLDTGSSTHAHRARDVAAVAIDLSTVAAAVPLVVAAVRCCVRALHPPPTLRSPSTVLALPRARRPPRSPLLELAVRHARPSPELTVPCAPPRDRRPPRSPVPAALNVLRA